MKKIDKKYFNLTELMVIFVIIIISAMILPTVFADAKESSADIICQNNLKILSAHFAEYRADYNGYFVPSRHGGYNGPRSTWMMYIASYFGQEKTYFAEKNMNHPLNNLACPHLPKDLRSMGFLTHYGVNLAAKHFTWQKGYGVSGTWVGALSSAYSRNESEIKDPAGTMQLIESVNDYVHPGMVLVTSGADKQNLKYVANNHNGKCPLNMIDGSVQMTRFVLPYESEAEARGFWTITPND
ncbi:MAG: hypothetical protein IJW31_04335 [Lentisphaeria bacterium]|nr:hypothetical protein [Lentisphaeria bacterium]